MDRYAATAVTFMITARTTRALFSDDTVKVADSKLQVKTVYLSYNCFLTINENISELNDAVEITFYILR